MLRDDVDDTLPRVTYIDKGIPRPTRGMREADSKGGRIMSEDVEVAEGSEIGLGAIGGEGADEGDGAWGDGGDEELVIKP